MEIKLLNGEKWDSKDLLSKMDDDSFYYGYLNGEKALSSSSIKKLLESPKAFNKSLRVPATGQALRDGRLVHLSVLEPHKLDELIVVDGTKAKKEFKDKTLEFGDHLVYTQSELNNAYWVAEAVKNNRDASFLLADCDYELSGIDVIGDIPFRAKADAITKDRNVIIDLKTTSGGVSEFKWSAKKYKYGLQAWLYKEIFGADEFIFLVVDKLTKDIGIFECSDSFLSQGQDDVARGIEIYKEYIANPKSKQLIDNYVVRGIL